jgi:ribosomal protein S18 acetylase RimI-like enzyme
MVPPYIGPVNVDLSRVEARGPALDDAAMVAARAFHDDPFFEFLDRRAVTRARGLALYWRASIAAAAASPGAQLTGARDDAGRLLGVSVVMPPGSYPLPAAAQVRQLLGALRAMVIRPAALVNGTRYLSAIEAAHPREALWYLMLLVVDPSAQRSGIGSRLQQEMLSAADADGLDCYLETQKPENVPYYRRFGYEVEGELRPVRKGPPLYRLRRRPR